MIFFGLMPSLGMDLGNTPSASVARGVSSSVTIFALRTLSSALLLALSHPASATATAVPIEPIESVGGEQSEQFHATSREAAPVRIRVRREGGSRDYFDEDPEDGGSPPTTTPPPPPPNVEDGTGHPPSDFTDTGKGFVSTVSVQYLAGLLGQETLRERLGDIHTFKPLDEKATPWVKVSATEWRVSPTLTAEDWDINFSQAKVGLDTRVGEKSLLGAYFSYMDYDSQRPAPANIRGTGVEGALYWSALTENRTFSDLVFRLGHLKSRYETTDTQGHSVKASGIGSTYWGLSWNVGRQVPVTKRFVLEPSALLGYTHFTSSDSMSSTGLRGARSGFNSLLSMLGSTFEGRFKTSAGKPFTLYGKLFWEKEWLAHTALRFNDFNTYQTDFKDSRWVYGFGVEGMLGRASTWHVDVERSTGSAFAENWQVNAGLRIPF